MAHCTRRYDGVTTNGATGTNCVSNCVLYDLRGIPG